MSISINCYSPSPFIGVQDKAELKAKLAIPPSTEKVRISALDVPSISPKTLEIFRELNFPAPSGINTFASNITKYCKNKTFEKSDSSLLSKIGFVAIMTLFLSIFSLPISFALEVPVFGLMCVFAAICGYYTSKHWSTSVLEKTKAKYAARADFVESYKFSIGSDALKLALENKLNTNDEEIQLAEKARVNAKSLWQKCFNHIKQPKIHTPDELKTAISEFEKVKAFYNRFDPVFEKTWNNTQVAQMADLFEQIGIPVPLNGAFDLNNRKEKLAEYKNELSMAEKKQPEYKRVGVLYLAIAVSLVAFGVLTTPAEIFGALAAGVLCALFGFIKPPEKTKLEDFQEVIERDKQEISKFLSKDYAALKEKLMEKLMAGDQTPYQGRLLHQAICHLKTLKNWSKSGFQLN